MTEQQGPGQADLATAIQGRTDEEIVALVAERGGDAVLQAVFAGMAAAFQPERAAGQSAVIQYDVRTAEGVASWQLHVAGGACTLARGAAQPPRVTLSLALPDFLRLIYGQLDGMQAFMTGKLQLSGDIFFPQMMQSWFASPRS